MNDQQIASVIATLVSNATNNLFDPFTKARIDAEAYYEGRPFGNEVANRSRYVQRTVAQAVDSQMPSLIRVFTSNQDIVRYYPKAPKFQELSDIVTEYVNKVWYIDNEGYQTLYTWFKAGLLFRIGIIKIWFDETEDSKLHEFEAMTEAAYQDLLQNPNIDFLEVSQYPDPEQLQLMENHQAAEKAAAIAAGQKPPKAKAQDTSLLPQLYDVKYRLYSTARKIKIEPMASEEFLYGQYKVRLDDRHDVHHRRKITKSELVEMGYSAKDLEGVTFGEDWDLANVEKMQRFTPENTMPMSENQVSDPSQQHAYITESYVYMDTDGDGVAEYRKITTVGYSAYKLMDNVETDHNPFAILCPYPLPFKMTGQGTFDKTRDLQEVQSALIRQTLDNTYNTVHQRPVISQNINYADVVLARPGAPIRSKGANPQADYFIPTPTPVIQFMMPIVEYFDSLTQLRTGTSPASQGMDVDELNVESGHAVNLLQQAGQQNLELIARNYAEMGLKTAFRKILHLISKHLKPEDIPGLQGKEPPIPMWDWPNHFDVICETGIGTGLKDIEVQRMQSLLQMDQQIIQMQGGPKGPLVTEQHLYNKLARIIEASGLKSVDLYYGDPSKQPPQPPPPPPPDPQAEIAKATLAQEGQQAQAELTYRIKESQAELAYKQKKLHLDYIVSMKNLEIQQLKAQLAAVGVNTNAEVAALNTYYDHEQEKMWAEVEALGMHQDQMSQQGQPQPGAAQPQQPPQQAPQPMPPNQGLPS
jgi:hypothetical protein